MKIVGFPNPSGAAFWRLHHPFKYLRQRGHEAIVSDEGITDEIAQWADIYVLQGTVDKQGVAALHAYQQEQGKRLVVDRDDALVVDEDSPFAKEHAVTNASEVQAITMQVADLVTVTTPHLGKEVAALNTNTVILPNMLDLDVWDLPKLANTSERVRIGWAGSMTHVRDIELVVAPLKRIMEEFPEVELVLVGDTRLKELFPTRRVECVLGVPFEAWPQRLHGLRFDIGLAPLRDTPFNRCKSNIKWLEYSIAMIPGVYSPTVYNFRGFDGDFGLIATNEEEWYAAIRNLVVSKNLRVDLARKAYALVRHKYDLARHADRWETAYKALVQS